MVQSLRATPAAVRRAVRAALILITVKRSLTDGTPTEDVLRSLTGHVHADTTTPQQAAAAVRRASRVVSGATCLPRAVAMAALLDSETDDLAVVLGSKRTASGKWIAHAWVEVGAVPWPGPDASTYQRLATYAARTEWALTPIRESR